MISNYQVKNLFIFVIAILIGVLLGVGIIFLTKKKTNYYAVFLNNGVIYYGKLSTFPRLKLSDAVFVQVDQDGQASLQRFKDVFWTPKGPIYLNRNSILFIAPIDENSPLINFIEQRRQPQSQQSQTQQIQQSQIPQLSETQPQP